MFAGDAQSGMMERFDVSTIIRFGSDMRSHIPARDRLPQAGTSVPLRSEPCFRCPRSEEHTSELQSLMRISYAVFCLKTQKHHASITHQLTHTTNDLYNY